MPERVERARLQYAREWSGGNARQFSADGHYQWMASFLPPAARVLEIGPGDGSGTAALLARGCHVLAVDENPACLQIAARKLRGAGYTVKCETRGHVRPAANGYRVDYAPPRCVFPHQGALLMEGDIGNDPGLFAWLQGQAPFDAITCWLMGTYYERSLNGAVAPAASRSPADYRAGVHQHLFQLASTLLNRDGLLHIVDRCLWVADNQGNAPGSPRWLAAFDATYRTLALGSPFDILGVQHLSYHEPVPGEQAAIRLTRSASGMDPDGVPKAFASVLFRRRAD